MTRARRVDGNQASIIRSLREHGVAVAVLSRFGCGVPDLLVALSSGENVLLEVKMRGGRLNDRQRSWLSAWPGRVHIVHDADEALGVLGVD